ncbi:MAG: cadherin-like beta sandwich domain-containing protein, partial [Acidimicrobiaceae bacterium]|nr:cadherin-like beta sandwich domain-containing protein [Acidimicrobiaceae bacterium]
MAVALIAQALALASVDPQPAQAQTVTTLISNTGQNSAGAFSTDAVYAQGFTTGTNAGGYTLSSIGLASTAESVPASVAVFRVELWSGDSDGPDSKLASLVVPSSWGEEVVSFTAPANTVLAPNTPYYVVFYENTAEGVLTFDTTASANEDAGAAAGWSIADDSHYQIGNTPDDTDEFSEEPDSPFLISVKGAPVPALVSNIGQTAGAGNSWQSTLSRAQGFTTGSNTGGYTLSTIEAKLRVSATLTTAQKAAISAELWSAATSGPNIGKPDSKITDLTAPSTLGDSAGTSTVAFAAPANTSLTASTTYFLVLKGAANLQNLYMVSTTSDSEDSGAATGWSIADSSLWSTFGAPNTLGAHSYNIRVNGIAASGSTPTQSTNANLSALGVSGATGSMDTFNALTLSPASFIPAVTQYAASVANSITHIQVTPTVDDTGKATVTVGGTVEDSGMASDAIALDVGLNVIEVVVTAEDGTTTKTYEVIVRRAASPGASFLVSNIGRAPIDNGDYALGNTAPAQPFTTGGNAGGYRLTSVTLSALIEDITADEIASLSAEVWSTVASGAKMGQPDTSIGTLTAPSTIADGNPVRVEFTSSAGIALEAGTQYFFVLRGPTSFLFTISLLQTASNDEEAGSQTGWSIGDTKYVNANGGATGAWTSENQKLQMEIAGTAVTTQPTITLTSNDSDNSVAESVGSVTITATLSEAPTSNVTVTISRQSASTATVTDDYTLAGSITVTSGTTAGTATLSVEDDSVVEADETLVLEATAGGDKAGAVAGWRTRHQHPA